MKLRFGRREIVAGTIGMGVAAAAGARPSFAQLTPESPNAGGEAPRAGALQPEAIVALAPGEQSIFLAGMMATTLHVAPPGSSPIYVNNPFAGCYASNNGFIGFPITVPVGSTLTGVDFYVYGAPRAGNVAVERYRPDSTGFDAFIFTQTVPAGTGAVSVSATLNEVHTGAEAYTAHLSTTSATNVLRAIRVRYKTPGGVFVPIAPKRVYDSRFNMAPDANGVLASGANRTVSVANGRNAAGAVDVPDLVPTSATAIAYTLTIADTVGSGFLSINPGGDTDVKASAINWTAPGQALANTGVVQLATNRTITAICGGGGATAFLIDVVGYYR